MGNSGMSKDDCFEKFKMLSMPAMRIYCRTNNQEKLEQHLRKQWAKMSEDSKRPYKEMRNMDIKTFILKKTMRESIMRETMITNQVKLEKLRNFGQIESKIVTENITRDAKKDQAQPAAVSSSIRPFTYYFKEMLKKHGKRSSKQTMKEYAQKWKSLPETQKQKYENLALKSSASQQPKPLIEQTKSLKKMNVSAKQKNAIFSLIETATASLKDEKKESGQEPPILKRQKV